MYVLELDKTKFFLHFAENLKQAKEIFDYECHENINSPFYKVISLYKVEGAKITELNKVVFQ
jgi:hypothetical protein